MKKIIVPIDFSEESIVALENTIKLANTVKLSIRMIHVKKKKNYYLGFPVTNLEEQPDDVYQKHFDVLLDKYRAKYIAGGKFDYVIRHGSISHEILKESAGEDVYAIFTGLQGNTSLKDYIIGSNATRVIAGARKPVFAIRSEMGLINIKKILIPIDDSPSTRIKVPIVTALAKELKAEVLVLAVSSSSYVEITSKVETYAKQTLDYLENNNVHAKLIESFNTDVDRCILETSQKESIDLLSFVSDMTDDPLGHLISGSIRALLKASDCAMLIIPINI